MVPPIPSTAYLVLFLNTAVTPANIMAMGIFSEATPTVGYRRYPITIISKEAINYDVAVEHIYEAIATDPSLAWVIAFLPCDDRDRVKALVHLRTAQQAANR